MLIYFLILELMIIAIISYYISKNDFFNPANTFCYAFILSSIFAIPYLDIWQFDMSESTFLAITIGISSFVVTYFLAYNLFYYTMPDKRILQADTVIKWKKKWIWFFFTIMQLLYMYLFYGHIMSSSIGGGTLFEKIFLYRIMYNAGDEDTFLPFYLRELGHISTCGTYVLIYVFFNNKVLKYVEKKIFINIIIYILSCLLNGARGEVVMVIFYIFSLSYIFKMRIHSWNYKINFKKLIKIICAGLISLSVFILIAFIALGRSDERLENSTGLADSIEGISYNASIYIGAELKLLDLFINEHPNGLRGDSFGAYTLFSLYNYIGRKFDMEELYNAPMDASELHKFVSINGENIGNVYTTFAAFYADGGLGTIAFFSSLMGGIFAFLYLKTKYTNISRISLNIDLYTMIYSYFYFSLILSFFTNWFYLSFGFSLISKILHFVILQYFFFGKKKIISCC